MIGPLVSIGADYLQQHTTHAAAAAERARDDYRLWKNPARQRSKSWAGKQQDCATVAGCRNARNTRNTNGISHIIRLFV
jgi:hypothetical protein